MNSAYKDVLMQRKQTTAPVNKTKPELFSL